MIHLVIGEDIYLLDVYRKKVKQKIELPEFNLLVTEKWEDSTIEFARNMPFVDPKKTIIIQNDCLNNAMHSIAESQIKYLINNSDNVELHILVENVDKRTSTYKQLQKHGDIILQNKNEKILQAEIVGFLQKNNCNIKKEAYSLLCEYIQYFQHDTNMYHVFNELKHLIFLQGEIREENIKQYLKPKGEIKMFEIIRYLCEKRVADAYKQIELIMEIDGGGEIPLLSLLLRTFRIQYKLGCGHTKQELKIHYLTYIPSITKEQAGDCMDTIQSHIQYMKTGFIDSNLALQNCIAKLVIIISEQKS